MDAAHDTRRQLGQLMVDEGFLTGEQLAHALAEQGRSGRPLGTILVELGFVSAGAVGNALAEQHGGLLKTEFGISAGLRAAPEAVRLSGSTPEPPSLATRIQELESVLRTVVSERDAFAQSVNELQARLSEAAQPDRAEVARVTAAAAARIAELEAEVQARSSEAQAHEAEVARVTAAAVAHIAELEAEVQARSSEAQAHEAEVARVTAAAAARIAELEAELQAALAGRKELETALRLGVARVSQLERELQESCEQVEQGQGEQAPEEATAGRAHLLFVPESSGYALIEFEGPDPPSGTLLDVDGVGYVVRRVGASPFPAGRLRCVFLERV